MELFLFSVALVLLAFGTISRKMEKSIISGPMVFVALGYLFSKGAEVWLPFEIETEVIHLLAEFTLVLVLFLDASRIDFMCLRREGNLPARLLAIGLPLTIGAGALAAFLIFPGVGIWEAVLLATILAPTDAALGQAVISSPLVPVRIRQCLNVESGLNDGIALPVVLVAASLAGASEQDGGFAYWTVFAALQIVLAPLVGALVGYLGGRIVERGVKTGWMSISFQRLSVLAIAALAYSGAELVGGNGFISAFVAGLTLGNLSRGICARLYDFGEAEGQFLTLLVFLMFGAVMIPAVSSFWDERVWFYAAGSLTIIRMVPVAISLLGARLQPASILFIGWFGPRGLASILFFLLVVKENVLANHEMLGSIVVLTVLLSTFAHGMSAYPAARWYGKFVSDRKKWMTAEHAPATDFPARIRHSQAAGESEPLHATEERLGKKNGSR